MKSLDGLILKLNVPKQKPFKKRSIEKPDLSEYPIEYRYLDRILYRLGPLFYGYKFADLPNANLEEAISYALSGNLKLKKDKKIKNMNKYCQKLNINILLVGPDLEDHQLIWAYQGKKDPKTQQLNKPFLVLLQSYEGLYYPLVNLGVDKIPHLFMYHDSKLIQDYVNRS